METRGVATVFGGSGFIGRYIVKRLAARGHVVRVAVRDPEAARFLKPMGNVGQIVPLFASIANEVHVQRAVEGAAIVVNTVGILAERRPGDFRSLQAEGAGRIARLSAAAGVDKMVHLSAIGADPASPSLYASTKAQGEAAVREAFPAATILRPSIVFGPEDQFFNRFASMAQILPIMPVIAGETRFQPVFVGDVADAALAAIDRADAAGGVFELGGPTVWTFRELLAYILDVTRRKRWMLDIPMPVMQFQAKILERLPTKPLTQDQLILLAKDNVVSSGTPGLAELGIVATPVEMIVPGYLRRYRPGGAKREVWPDEIKASESD